MKNHNVKAALFDLDGVIAFTDKYHYLAWKKIADEMGFDFNETVNNRLRGIPRMASLEEILKHNNVSLPIKEKLELAEKKNNYYVELLNDINESDIYTGSIEFIKELKKRGIKTSICSSSKNADLVLEKLNIRDLFDAVVTGNDIKNAKPDPEVFLLGAEKLGIPAFHCAVFEDSRVGIIAAKTGNMKNVGVGNFEETGDIADNFIKDYSEIDIDTFIESGNIKRMPIITDGIVEEEFDKNKINAIESLMALGNGYLGIRATYDEEEEGEICGTYINSFFATEPIRHLFALKGYAKNNEFTVNLPDWRIINLYIDGEKAEFKNNNIFNHRRTLNFFDGKLERNFVFETKSGKKVEVNSIRLLNRNDVHGAEVSYKVKNLGDNCTVNIESAVVKNTKLNGNVFTEIIKENVLENGYFETVEVTSTKQMASVAIEHNVIADNYFGSVNDTPERYSYNISCELKNGETVVLEKYAAFAAYIDNSEDTEIFAKTLASDNKNKGFNYFLNEQKEFWKEHWEKSDIEISGNDADQQAVRYSLFQLKQQLATVNQCSIGATGLTGPGYSGQVFWDTEMYLMPYYNYTNPQSQKELLMYRYRILDKARARAKEFDTVGAMYSWCSIDGEETSTVYEASTAEYHLNSDISYAIWRYVTSTNDKEFLYNYGAEILFETAKFMAHRGVFVPARGGRFCMNAVCGPDEYACGVNNNFYTNLSLKRHLEYAISVVNDMKENANDKFVILCEKISLTDEEIERWENAANNMWYKYNEDLGIYEQDDSYVYEDPADMSKIPMNYDIRGMYHPLDLWRLQVSKQADVCLATFLYGDFFTKEEKLRCYDYYEQRCNHGSSLSTAIYSICAAEIDKKEAYEFFRCSAYMDIYDFKKNTNNGIHIACAGGVWMSVINGFLGLRHYNSGILFEPRIPKAWNSYKTKITYLNSTVEIFVNKDEASFVLACGDTISFRVWENDIKLDNTNPNYVCKVKVL